MQFAYFINLINISKTTLSTMYKVFTQCELMLIFLNLSLKMDKLYLLLIY